MLNRFAYSTTCLFVTVFLGSVAGASETLDFFEVAKVAPSRVIKHDVSLKGRFDEDVVMTYLAGPQLFSHAVGFGDKGTQDRGANFNWYQITRPSRETPRVISVRDGLQGSVVYQVRIDSPVYLLSPAQKLASGTPAPASDRLSHFKAYRIANGAPVNKEVRLTNSFGPENRIAVKPALLCVPAEEWHHAEHFPIKRAEDCLVVYEMQPRDQSSVISTIDQFGLNALTLFSSVWLCAPAEIVPEPHATRE